LPTLDLTTFSHEKKCATARVIIKYRETSVKELKNIDSNFTAESDEERIEDIILRAWEQKGIDKIINFVNQGGNVLATGKSGFLLEKLGLIEEGSYITDKNLYYKEKND